MIKLKENNRDDTIFLKFLAIIIILNSHFDDFYPISYLATAGAIGNSAFFMLSSYGLFLSFKNKNLNFVDFYGNRIIRIYPTVWVELILFLLPYKILENFGFIKLNEINSLTTYVCSFLYPFQHWFLHALMIYYLVFFILLKNYNIKKIFYMLSIAVVLYTLVYTQFIDLSQWLVEAHWIKYVSYFIMFLFGIILAHNKEIIKYNGLSDCYIFVSLISIMYLHKFMMIKNHFIEFQFLQQILIVPIVFYLFKMSRSYFILNTIMKNKTIRSIITYISDRTLEIYILHYYFIHIANNINLIFPLNIIFIITSTLLAASLVKSIAKKFTITLRDQSIKKIFLFDN